MSLILDALRKLEQERKTKRPGGIDLRPDVLSYRGAPKASGAGRIALACAALMLTTGIVAFFYAGNEKSPPLIRTAPAEPVMTAVPEALPVEPVPSKQPQPPQPLESRPRKTVDRPGAVTKPALTGVEGVAVGGGAYNLAVSGIAWQEERSLRRAVVNGSLFAEGAEINGARILEIKENRVRFSRSGQVFEVLYP